jgi:polysaccharide biosynthesis protein PslG
VSHRSTSSRQEYDCGFISLKQRGRLFHNEMRLIYRSHSTMRLFSPNQTRRARRQPVILLIALLLPIISACGSIPAPDTTRPVAEASSSVATNTASTPPQPTLLAEAATALPPTRTPEPTVVPATPTRTPEPTPIPPTPTPAPRIPPAFGVVSHLYYTDRATVLSVAAEGGFEWIRQQVPWKDTEAADRTFGFDELDKIVASTHASGRKLLLSLVKSPDWATGRPGDNGLPQNPNDFARFAETVALRYKGRVHAIEVWNEQNLAVENGGRVEPADAARYVEVLKATYPRIKAVDPSIVVIAGALSSTGVTQPDLAVDDIVYLQAMYRYNNGEIRNYFDVQGFHPASTLNPPEFKFPDNPGPRPAGCEGSCWQDAPTHYFRHIENVRQVMFDSGMGDKQIWITEMGWTTANTSPGYEYGNFVSLEQQAAYLEGALRRIVYDYDYVGGVFIWNLNFAPLWNAQGNPVHEQAAFGLVNPDWSRRPAFVRVQQFINEIRANGVVRN